MYNALRIGSRETFVDPHVGNILDAYIVFSTHDPIRV